MSSPKVHSVPALISMKRLASRVKHLIMRPFAHQGPRPYSHYLPLKETLRAAEAAGLSVGEYIERKHATGPKTPLDLTMEGLEALGVFNDPIERVCEIGSGSGRYLERVVKRCHPRIYEIYETSTEWRTWVVERYGVVARTCDGRTLSQTESGAVDLVQAHKLFGGGLPFLNTIAYMREMARVVRTGGWVVFDIMTEACFTPERLDGWFAANPWGWPWSPHMMARDYVVRLFAAQSIGLVGSFEVPLFPGTTECLVFRKTASPSDRVVR